MAITGTVRIEVQAEGENPTGVTLRGNGTNWCTDGSGIVLEPGHEPAHFSFMFELTSHSFSLVGLRILLNSSGEAKIHIPASAGKVNLELVDAIPHGSEKVIIHFSVGIGTGNNEPHWIDPTIAFDPQGEPPHC